MGLEKGMNCVPGIDTVPLSTLSFILVTPSHLCHTLNNSRNFRLLVLTALIGPIIFINTLSSPVLRECQRLLQPRPLKLAQLLIAHHSLSPFKQFAPLLSMVKGIIPFETKYEFLFGYRKCDSEPSGDFTLERFSSRNPNSITDHRVR